MRTLVRVALVALFASAILATQARAGASDAGAEERCSGHSQAGMRECLASMALDSANRLKQAEARALAGIAGWFENVRYRQQARAALLASGVAHARYRDAQCRLAAALVGGGAGNGHEIRRLACVIDLNEQREHALARAAALPRD